MRKRRVRKAPIIVVLLFICLVFGSLYLFKEYFQKEDVDTPISEDKSQEKTYQTTFTLAGNVLLNKEMWTDALTDNKYDFSNMFEYLNDIMKKSDINLYSQASTIGGSDLGSTGFVNGVYSFNSPTELGDELIKVGFNAVSLAGYHAYDKGSEGITNSIKYWESKNIMHSGISDSEENRLKNNTFKKDGITYALLSYAVKTDTAFTDKHAVNIYSEGLVKSDIETVKKNADIVIVSIDWTDSTNTEVTEEQKTIVNYLIKNGANIIVGNNTNVIEPIEIIDNTLVCYSLGNLISGHALTDSRISAVVDFELDLTKKKDSTEINFKDIDVLLTYAYNENSANYKVIPFSKINTELEDYATYYNKYKDMLTKDKDYIKLYTIGEENGDIKS